MKTLEDAPALRLDLWGDDLIVQHVKGSALVYIITYLSKINLKNDFFGTLNSYGCSFPRLIGKLQTL